MHGESGSPDDGEWNPSLSQAGCDALEQTQPISSSMHRQGRRPFWR